MTCPYPTPKALLQSNQLTIWWFPRPLLFTTYKKDQNQNTPHNRNVGNIENTGAKRPDADIEKIHDRTAVEDAVHQIADATGNKQGDGQDNRKSTRF
jgi:hypothetical protein